MSFLLSSFSAENVLLCGVWYDSDKPEMQTFLRPLVDTLNKLYEDGMYILSVEIYWLMFYMLVGIDVVTQMGCLNVRCIGTFDVPARSAVTNMKQYNCEYLCSTCLEKGDNNFTRNAFVRYWPYQTYCTERTAGGVFEAARKATRTSSVVGQISGNIFFCPLDVSC